MIADILRSEPSESESSEMNSTSDELRENGDMDSSGDDPVHPAYISTNNSPVNQNKSIKRTYENNQQNK